MTVNVLMSDDDSDRDDSARGDVVDDDCCWCSSSAQTQRATHTCRSHAATRPPTLRANRRATPDRLRSCKSTRGRAGHRRRSWVRVGE